MVNEALPSRLKLVRGAVQKLSWKVALALSEALIGQRVAEIQKGHKRRYGRGRRHGVGASNLGGKVENWRHPAACLRAHTGE